jgi:hypothetical protein
MEHLKENWLTDGLIDFEYKKYLLLAYLKSVRDSFQRVELYPFLADLVFHYRNMMALKENKALIYDRFPKHLSMDSLRTLELNYKKIIEDDAIMKEIESIIEFSLPQIQSSMKEGSVIYEYVESQCQISPVGLTALYANEGYLFISQPPENETEVYRYQVTIFDNSTEILRGIHTRYLLKARKSFSNTYEQLKLTLIKQYADLPNPATYLVLSKLKFPLNHTLMPVAKRLLVKQISSVT